MYCIKVLGHYIKLINKSSIEITDDISLARTFKRKCDATQSIRKTKYPWTFTPKVELVKTMG